MIQISDDDLEWAVRLAMESRRRVKEQQKRVGAMEFRNTHFSYTMGEDGVEQFVTTPELQSDPTRSGADPLPPARSGRSARAARARTRAVPDRRRQSAPVRALHPQSTDARAVP